VKNNGDVFQDRNAHGRETGKLLAIAGLRDQIVTWFPGTRFLPPTSIDGRRLLGSRPSRKHGLSKGFAGKSRCDHFLISLVLCRSRSSDRLLRLGLRSRCFAGPVRCIFQVPSSLIFCILWIGAQRTGKTLRSRSHHLIRSDALFDPFLQRTNKKPEDLDIKDSMVFEKANPGNRKKVRDVADAWWTQDPPIFHPVAGGFYGYEPDGTAEPKLYAMARQAHFIEVEVDTETGMVDVTNIVCVNDVGHLFNYQFSHKAIANDRICLSLSIDVAGPSLSNWLNRSIGGVSRRHPERLKRKSGI
jgi:hypothetical protein